MFRLRVFFLLVLNLNCLSFALADDNLNLLLGPRVNRNAQWQGSEIVSSSISILVMAGHADSQEMNGDGTPGEAVALFGKSPMDSTMSDEVFWNLKFCSNIL